VRTASDEHDLMATQRLANFNRPEKMPDPQDMLAIKENLHPRFFPNLSSCRAI
jgi:hypothetical protein